MSKEGEDYLFPNMHHARYVVVEENAAGYRFVEAFSEKGEAQQLALRLCQDRHSDYLVFALDSYVMRSAQGQTVSVGVGQVGYGR